jgi:hypothetical protein
MGYLFILELLIASYLGYRVRKSLKKTGQYLMPQGKRSNARPSVETIMEYLNFIEVVILDGKRYFPQNYDKQALNLVAGRDMIRSTSISNHCPGM